MVSISKVYLRHYGTSNSSCDIFIENPDQSLVYRTNLYLWNGTCVGQDGIDPYDSTDRCIESTASNHISSLRRRVVLTSFPAISASCVRMHACISGNNCSTNGCTSFSTGVSSSNTAADIATALQITPGKVLNLNATPGNTTALLSWDSPGNTEIDYYSIMVAIGASSPIAYGYYSGEQVTVSNLINGTTYTFTIAALSNDGLQGEITTKTFTPTVSCTTPTCGFSLA